jgi:hypothetical protein
MMMWLSTVTQAWLAQPTRPEDDQDFGIWYAVLVVLIVAPIVMYTLKFFADRRRDRMTRELIADSNKDGAVPDVPKDFEIPQVVPRKSERGFGRWKRRR